MVYKINFSDFFMIINEWYLITREALRNGLFSIFEYLPKLLWALIVLVFGWFVAALIGKLVTNLLNRIQLNRIFEKEPWKSGLEKASVKTTATEFLGYVLRWVLVIVFLLASVEILELDQFALFLAKILRYLNNVIVAILIFVVVAAVNDILAKGAVVAAESAKLKHSCFIGGIVKWAIWIFAGFAILDQLEIAPSLVQTLIIGTVAVLVISFGLAFGLAGKETAAEILADLRKRLKS